LELGNENRLLGKLNPCIDPNGGWTPEFGKIDAQTQWLMKSRTCPKRRCASCGRQIGWRRK
jgi:hypothetical protein